MTDIRTFLADSDPDYPLSRPCLLHTGAMQEIDYHCWLLSHCWLSCSSQQYCYWYLHQPQTSVAALLHTRWVGLRSPGPIFT
ncbi:hypothetical protein V6N11_016190 [Hibiscus sabdariffa]|uniref:Uncharacterized protein n=1 Tax=Hibiscus sabdariffa TaxID=183260 RepID=A0ABR2TUG5_9ROSI